jgi:cytochrome P450
VARVTSFLLNHPDYIKYVLVDHSRNFVKGRILRANRLLLGNGLITNEGESWLTQRRLVQPAFHHQRVAAYGRIMVNYAERLTASWRDGEVRDIHQEMNCLAQEVAAKTRFDADLASETEEISHAFRVGLGEAFAMLELCLVIATIAPRYHFTLLKEQSVDVLPSITLHPKEGIRIRLNRRSYLTRNR